MRIADVGAMRERVQIQTQSQTVNGAGDIATTWTTSSTVWARMKPMDANEIRLAGRDEGTRGFTMMIRYGVTINNNCKVLWRGAMYDVQGVLDRTEQRQFLEVKLFQRNA